MTNLGEQRNGETATGPTVTKAGRTGDATEFTGQLGITGQERAEAERTGEAATGLTGQLNGAATELDWTCETATEQAELMAVTESRPGRKQGEDKSTKSRCGRESYET